MSLTEQETASSMTWDLSDLFDGPGDPRLDETIDRATSASQAFADKYRGTIDVPGGPSTEHLLGAFQTLEDLIDQIDRVGGYSHLLFSADTAQSASRDLEQKVRIKGTAIQNLLVFFELEWQ
jgi:oligoendopeptidase F